ncbi:MAG: ABC transporter permease subunit [Verrucomicrobiales bacterium]|nr:ABC transporter permease subunit [Verrucomicrobiales bacterium]
MADSEPANQKPAGRTALISVGRIWTIAASTFTQLVRMKTFYFLLAFAVLLVAAGNLNILFSAVEQLSMIKKVSFGTMDLFAWLFAIVATALLIPRDLEDRTLYTILSKPVLRIEYLLGKLIGVLVVILLSLVTMFVIFSALLHIRTIDFLHTEVAILEQAGRSQEMIQAEAEAIIAQGLRKEMWVALWAIFLKSAVVASVTIFLSTIASSSLFTIIISTIIFLVGHASQMMIDFWKDQFVDNIVVKMLAGLFRIIVPDYQIFSFYEGIILGEKVLPHLVWSMTGMSLFYVGVFLLLGLLVFFDKEF